MYPRGMNDLDQIVALGAADAELDALDKEIAALQARIPAARGERDAAEGAVVQAKTHLEALRETERATAREVERYTRRRATAVRALETGMGNADAAQKQVEQCDAIIDDLETRQLEEMEGIEGARDALASTEATLAEAERHLTAEETTVPPILATRQNTRAGKQAARDAIWSEVPKDLQSRYTLVRKKKKTAVTFLVDGYCKSCRMKPPLETTSEIGRGFLKTCPGCGRYLVAPPE